MDFNTPVPPGTPLSSLAERYRQAGYAVAPHQNGTPLDMLSPLDVLPFGGTFAPTRAKNNLQAPAKHIDIAMHHTRSAQRWLWLAELSSHLPQEVECE